MKPVVPLIATALLLGSTAAWSEPGYYLVEVYEDQGAAHLDFRYWTVQVKGRPEVVWPELGLGYGVTKRWYTELYTSYEGSGFSASTPSTVNWQNDLLLTQGQYDVDVALHTNLIKGQSGTDDDALEFGPVLQTDTGRVQWNANLIFEKSLSPGSADAPQLKYQWQAKYRWKNGVQAGVQSFGELGPWNQWLGSQNQSHRWGPVISSTWELQGNQRIVANAAYLSGKVFGTAADMLSVRLQYVF